MDNSAVAQAYLPGLNRRARWKVRDTALILKRFYFCQRALVLSQGAWLAGIAPFDIKTGIPKYLWQNALTVAALRDRILELRFPNREMDLSHDKPLVELFTAAKDAPSAGAFVGALAQVHLPALVRAYQKFLGYSDQIGDGPTHRFLDLAICELKDQVRAFSGYAERLLALEPGERGATEQWIRDVRAQLEAVGGLTVEDAAPRAAQPFASPVRKPWQLAETPARDARFHRLRFYWPDIVDADHPYGEGVQLQLRSAISHFNEVWAVEAAGAILHAFADVLDLDFLTDAARWCYDESRHCVMGLERLTAWGFAPGEIPLGSYIFDSARGQDPIYRLGMLFFFETKNIGKKPKRIAEFVKYRDCVSEHDMDFDWADEAIHASFGKRWLGEVLKLRGQAPGQDAAIRARCGELVDAIVATRTAAEIREIKAVAAAMTAKAQSIATG